MSSSTLLSLALSVVLVTSAVVVLVPLSDPGDEPDDPSHIVVTVVITITWVKAIDEIESDGEDWYAVAWFDSDPATQEFPDTWTAIDGFRNTHFGNPSNMVLEHRVKVSKGAVSVALEMRDFDGLTEGNNYNDITKHDFDKFDIAGRAAQRVFFVVNFSPCGVTDPTLTGGVTEPCDRPDDFYSIGYNSPSAEVEFRVDVVDPAWAPGLHVRCTHTPLWPQPGERVLIRAEALDDAANRKGATADLEIWFNDQSNPIVTGNRMDNMTFFTAPVNAPSFFYGCRALASNVEFPVFTGWRNVTVGALDKYPGLPEPFPVILVKHRVEQAIDIVIIPDEDDYPAGVDDADFLLHAEEAINRSYYLEPLFLYNQQVLNFYLSEQTGRASRIGGSCSLVPPSLWFTLMLFADAGFIMHTREFRDCARPEMQLFSSKNTSYRTILHETGHAPFGLQDSYCCDSSPDDVPVPNVYSDLASCQSDAPSVGKEAKDCYIIFSDFNRNGWRDHGETLNDADGDNRLDMNELFIDWDSDGRWDQESEPFTDTDGDEGHDAETFTDWDRDGQWDDYEPYVDSNGNGIWDPEPFIDFDGDGRRDRREPSTDINGNGVWDAAEDLTTDWNGNGRYDPAETLQDLNHNGEWNLGEKFIDRNGDGIWNPADEFNPSDDIDGDGFWDAAEEFTDSDNDGIWTNGEPLVDTGNRIWDEAEPFKPFDPAWDLDGDGFWDAAEEFTDSDGDGDWDQNEPFVDTGNRVWNPGDTFIDSNGNNVWDDEEELTYDQNGDGDWDPGDTFKDEDLDGVWDEAELFLAVWDLDNDGAWDPEDKFDDKNGDGWWQDTETLLTDENGNGEWDPAEWWVDSNGNGVWQPEEPFHDLDCDGRWDPAESYNDTDGDGVWDPAEPLEIDHNGNGLLDMIHGDLFDPAINDLDGDGVWDPPEPLRDWDGDFEWDDEEEFTDMDGDGVWDPGEDLFNDLNGNAKLDFWEPLTDGDGNGVWDPAENWDDTDLDGMWDDAECFFDRNRNKVWDASDTFNDVTLNEFFDREEPNILWPGGRTTQSIGRYAFTSDRRGSLMDQNGPLDALETRRIDLLFELCDRYFCAGTLGLFITEDPTPSPMGAPGEPGPDHDPDPRFMPIPDLFFQSEAISIVVELLFRGKTDVAVNGVTVVPWPSHVSLMDPPQLHIQLEDDFGNPAGQRNSWHPLEVESYEGDDHTWSLLDESVGHFAVPFQDGLEWMDFDDVRLDLDLIRVDLKPAIYTFCGANPLEAVCMANFTFPSLIEEGRPAQFTNTSRGPTDGLINAWEWDFGDGTTSTAEHPSHIFGDDGTFRVRLKVTDVDGLTDSVMYDITVQNVAPTIDQDVHVFAVVDVTLRVAGEKWHDVRLTVTQDGVPGATASVTRFPGSPDAQAATLADQEVTLIGSTTGAVVEYTPDDDPENGQPWGANPVLLILTLEDDSEFEVHHTFNVRHLSTHVWTIDNLLDVVDLVAVPIHFRASATDPGSDDLTFTWDWGDLKPIVSTKYFNDPAVGDDPFPSPEIHPRDVTDDVTHVFAVAGTYLVTLTVEDDDGGVDQVTVRVEI